MLKKGTGASIEVIGELVEEVFFLQNSIADLTNRIAVLEEKVKNIDIKEKLNISINKPNTTGLLDRIKKNNWE